MDIRIGENYRITKDSLNFILLRKKKSDPNHHFSKGVARESWGIVGYYSKFEHLADSLIEKEIKENEVKILLELVAFVKEIKQHLTVQLRDTVSNTEEVEEIITKSEEQMNNA